MAIFLQLQQNQDLLRRNDQALQNEVLSIIQQHHDEHQQTLASEQAMLERELNRWGQEAGNLVV